MEVRDLAQRVFQREVAIMSANGGTRPSGWVVLLHPEDYIDVVIEERDSNSPITFDGQRHYILGIPMQRGHIGPSGSEHSMERGEVRIRTEVAA